MRKLLGCAVVLLAAAVMPAQAQVSFGVGGGLLMPMGTYGDLDKLGFTGGVGVLFPIGTAPVSVRLEGTFSQTSHKDFGGSAVDGNTRIIGGMASLVYLFQSGGSVTPYVLAGVGYYNGKVTVPSVSFDESESKVGFGGGAGLRFPMGSAALFVEARYINIATSGDPTTYLPIIAGVSFGGR